MAAAARIAAMKARIQEKASAGREKVQARLDADVQKERESDAQKKIEARAEAQKRALEAAEAEKVLSAKRAKLAEGEAEVVPKCRCRADAKEMAVKKEGPNCGRKFWGCAGGMDNKCDFFTWSKTIAPSPTKEAPSGAVGETASELVLCRCKLAPAKFAVKKEGPNMGRSFYKCEMGNCKFFEWVPDATPSSDADPDASPVPTPAKAAAPASVFGSGGAAAAAKAKLAAACAAANTGGPGVMCTCGLEALEVKVKKEGPNLGRRFLTCGKQKKEERCRFFQWGEAEAAEPAAGPAKPNYQFTRG